MWGWLGCWVVGLVVGWALGFVLALGFVALGFVALGFVVWALSFVVCGVDGWALALVPALQRFGVRGSGFRLRVSGVSIRDHGFGGHGSRLQCYLLLQFGAQLTVVILEDFELLRGMKGWGSGEERKGGMTCEGRGIRDEEIMKKVIGSFGRGFMG